MTLQPLACAPRPQMPAAEVPGLAYYCAPAAAPFTPRIAKPRSPAAEALAQMYGYYSAAD